MARKFSQGLGTEGGAPKFPAPDPGSSSSAADRLDGVRQTSILALSERTASNKTEIHRSAAQVSARNKSGSA